MLESVCYRMLCCLHSIFGKSFLDEIRTVESAFYKGLKRPRRGRMKKECWERQMDPVSSGGSGKATVSGYRPPQTMLPIWLAMDFPHLNHQKPSTVSTNRDFILTLSVKRILRSGTVLEPYTTVPNASQRAIRPVRRGNRCKPTYIVTKMHRQTV